MSWLQDGRPPIGCLLSIGSYGQAIVSPLEGPLATQRRRFSDALTRSPTLLRTAEGYRASRFFASTWERSIQENFQLTLPEELIKGWSPDIRHIVVIGLIKTLEIWTPTSWLEDVAKTSDDYEDLLETLLDSPDE